MPVRREKKASGSAEPSKSAASSTTVDADLTADETPTTTTSYRQQKPPPPPSSEASDASGTLPEKWELNSRVLCRHSTGLFYEGKIIDIKADEDGKPVYTVHYQGWNARFDEKIPE